MAYINTSGPGRHGYCPGMQLSRTVVAGLPDTVRAKYLSTFLVKRFPEVLVRPAAQFKIGCLAHNLCPFCLKYFRRKGIRRFNKISLHLPLHGIACKILHRSCMLFQEILNYRPAQVLLDVVESFHLSATLPFFQHHAPAIELPYSSSSPCLFPTSVDTHLIFLVCFCSCPSFRWPPTPQLGGRAALYPQDKHIFSELGNGRHFQS